MAYTEISNQVQEKEAWTNFVQEDLAPLLADVRKLVGFREQLEKLVGLTLGEASTRDQRYRPLLIGGISDEGEYKENSFAGYIDQLFSIKLDNPKKWIVAQKTGLNPDNYTEIVSSSPPFVTMLNTVREMTVKIANKVDTKLPANAGKGIDEIKDEVLEDPQELIRTAQRVLERLINLSAGSNPFTFFAYTTRSISRRYLNEAYPSFGEQLPQMESFLGLENIFTPVIDDKETQGDYSIWTHEENGLLSLIARLNDIAWEMFENEELNNTIKHIVQETPHPKRDFKESADTALSTIDWAYPEYIPLCARPESIPKSPAYSTGHPKYRVKRLRAFEIENGLLTRKFVKTCNTSSVYNIDEELEEPVSLFRFLNDVMPGVFLGKYELEASEKEQEVSVYYAS